MVLHSEGFFSQETAVKIQAKHYNKILETQQRNKMLPKLKIN